MKKIILALCVVIATTTTFSFAKEKDKNRDKDKNKNAGGTMSCGTEKEQNERAEWEWKRLHDPATGKIPVNIREKELAFATTLPNDGGLDKYGRSVAFTSRGPYNYGGRTRAIAVDKTNDNIMLAGAVSGGMWRSANGGNSWTKVSLPSDHQSVTCIAQDTRVGKTNNWYFGSGEGYGTSASGNGAFYLGSGLFKSSDNGLTWNKLTSTGANNNPTSFTTVWDVVWDVATDPSNDTLDVVYAATYGAVWKTKNGGTNWSVVRGSSTASPSSYFSGVVTTSIGAVYAMLSSEGTQKGIWRSADGGTTWTNILPSNFHTTYGRVVGTTNPQNENEVYFLVAATDSVTGRQGENFEGTREWNGLWKYTYTPNDTTGVDDNWTNLSPNLPNDNSQFGDFNVQGGYDLVIKVKPDNPNVVIIGGTNLYRSTDAFSTSQNVTQIGGYGIGSTIPYYTVYANHHPDQHGLVFLPSNPNMLISTSDGGIRKTNNVMDATIVWNSLNTGYLSTQLYTLGIDHGTPNDPVIVSGAQDNGTLYTNSTSATANWTMPSSGDGSYCAISNGGQNYYFSRQQGIMAKATISNMQMSAWTRIDPPQIPKTKYQFINPFILDPNDNNIMYMAGGSQVWRNNKLNQFVLNNQWNTQALGWDSLATTLDPTRAVMALGISTIPANILYYGTDSGKVYRIDNANLPSYSKTDITGTSTVSWPNAGNVSCIAVDPHDANNIIVVFSNYNVQSIFYSTNGGTSWIKVGGNLENSTTGSPSVRWASILHVSDGVVYFVGTSTGVYGTDTLIATGAGTTTKWVLQGTQTIGNVVVDCIDVRESDGLVVLATHGNGVFSKNVLNVDQVTTIKTIEQLKPQLYLSNYPNPAKDATTIEFTLNKNEKVVLKIVDELGRDVTTLINTECKKGKNSTTYNTSSLANGVYYYSLQTNDASETKKLIITK